MNEVLSNHPPIKHQYHHCKCSQTGHVEVSSNNIKIGNTFCHHCHGVGHFSSATAPHSTSQHPYTRLKPTRNSRFRRPVVNHLIEDISNRNQNQESFRVETKNKEGISSARDRHEISTGNVLDWPNVVDVGLQKDEVFSDGTPLANLKQVTASNENFFAI